MHPSGEPDRHRGDGMDLGLYGSSTAALCKGSRVLSIAADGCSVSVLLLLASGRRIGTRCPEVWAAHAMYRSWVEPGATIRPATAEDAERAIVGIRSSITELCTDDHQHDPGILENWLGNKTVSHFEIWLAKPDLYVVVAERGTTICGVGMLRSDGAIRLCYVDPQHTRRGVGRALMDGLEAYARGLGLRRLQLDSTRNATAFYEGLGFRSSAPPSDRVGASASRPYEKLL